MIRKKEQIANSISHATKALHETIDQAVDFEKANDEKITYLRTKLKEFSSETSYEDTLEGRIKNIEGKTFSAVTLLLRELSEITGNEYSIAGGSL